MNAWRLLDLGRRSLSVVLLAVASEACSSTDDPKFTFGKADMQSVILGTWSGLWAADSDAPSALTLELEDAPSGSLRPACNDRVFSSPSTSGLHPACLTSSALRLVGSLSVADGSVTEPALEGQFYIDGLNLGPGALELANADGTFKLGAEPNPSGGFRYCRGTIGERLVACTLEARH